MDGTESTAVGARDPDSLPELFFILVARCRNRMPGVQQREMAVSILEVLDNVGEDPATYKFLVVRKKSEDPFNDILRAVEGCDDDLAIIVLCRILQGYCTKTTSNVRIKRMRKLTALDATKSLIQALRDLLKDKRPSEEKLIAIDAVAFTLMLLAPKDRKFTLKTRLGGLLPSLAAQLCSQEPKRLSLMTLLARCARS
uniref:Uncharacterized protein n=1 Tax=Plectus sambesii TaxID=2011161 RepID=A0A914WMI7_9BILA